MRAPAMVRLYREYWRINVLTTLEYRENFVLWLLFTVVYHGTAIAALYVVLHTFPSMNGWNFRDTAFLYGLWMMAHATHGTFFHAVSDVPEKVRDGEFDRVLVRPVDALFLTIATPGQVFPDELVLALVTFAAATWFAGVHVTLGFIVLVPLVVVGGALIELAVDLAIATLSFWFVRVDAVRWIVLQLEQEFTRYPLGIYPRSVRFLLAFVIPFGFMNYFPATFLLDKNESAFGLSPAVGFLSPLVGVVAVSLAYRFWRFGLDRYQGVGH